MNTENRLEYLQAMGIEVWLPKDTNVELPATLASKDQASAMSIQSPAPIVQTASVENTPSIDSVDTWEKLATEVKQCQQCQLATTRTQTVFGSGNKNADWMLIGEAPGAAEDLQGKPFMGTAGLLLTEMLRAIELNREQVFIANILKCRPPNNRNPNVSEVKNCRNYLHRQIALIQPKIILAVGRIAAQNLLNTTASLTKLRGKEHEFNNIPVVVVYHPAYLLRFLHQKNQAWQDLQFALSVYQLDILPALRDGDS